MGRLDVRTHREREVEGQRYVFLICKHSALGLNSPAFLGLALVTLSTSTKSSRADAAVYI